MQIISAHTPQRTASGGIELMVTFEGVGEVPFHATPTDSEAHGRELYTRAMIGEFGDVAPYTPPVVSLEDAKAAKMERINEGKNVSLDSGFLHDGTLYDSDIKARLAYLEVEKKLLEVPGYSTGWKASRGQWVTMDAELFASLQTTYEAHISACFAWQAAREMEVAAAQTVAEVEAVSEVMP
ncbi:MAG: DUF4376 domain-containing protein [Chloroflexia bacterium]|nr:DUF4376 domain-containing protein [Chloroflexia bacterium]